ncbi:DUF4229 domain-containing protein [Dactylosporangium sp. NPDC000244]|uniref:DUF4229 domain-containing protein n=1 Tax=Dactylosporangium sp. NPDC000244 TaxID=3154365 RepID=UPI003328685D
MSPFLKYTLARLGLFGLAALVMLSIPLDVSVLLKLMIAVIVSAVAAFFLLRGLREEASVQAVGMAQKRSDNKERLRAALNGDDDGGESATKSD